MSRVYTRLGDDGSTGLLFGGRVSKADDLVAVVGTLDEAVAALGLARASLSHRQLREQILRVQRELFVVGADIASNPRARDQLVAGVSLVTSGMVADIEALIDTLVAEQPLRPVFVVPGESLGSAAIDLGRTIVRRAERQLVGCRGPGAGPDPLTGTAEGADAHRWPLVYLNRVSDLLYVLARQANDGLDEPPSHHLATG
ncbi:MAG: cob(I)yrinic acid a,c-diamide adenosyltransferase [Ornithinimicrobium sp.]|uniref:cob(I)yrinic acid a,c-diamide adenosyltransferase n=1 Tax=Ornithinimicrobium sp. TaxID=1977084 RepID=UPI0026DEB209|nr:cob(I)yrinic acid a,c-diamide adenosyltransferase [Ornithinimicrobium sp.]MDO5740017.1 cob(I)yrinic acid a,c-diamide adenosyltransferase [Ornithinimicrobium sp.]